VRVQNQKSAKKIYAANPEKVREGARKRYAANIEKSREYARKSALKLRATNPERLREKARKHYVRNRDKELKKRAEWRAENREAIREVKRNGYAMFALMRDILLDVGLIRKEDTEAEQYRLVTAYRELGLINREEIEEWLRVQKLKKA
jgi:hypothetical protein